MSDVHVIKSATSDVWVLLKNDRCAGGCASKPHGITVSRSSDELRAYDRFGGRLD